MKLSQCAISAAAVLGFAAIIQTLPTQAATSAATAVGSCLANTTEADVNLRKRPLAMRNEGATAVYVSCAAQYGFNPDVVESATVVAINTNAAPVEFTCTLVDGALIASDLIFFYPKTITLPSNGAAVMNWFASDNGGTTFTGFENFSCLLPPGVEIDIVGFTYY